jgi:hypothetical protein
MQEPMVDTAIFLGAGASKAEGAPLQGELFADYFSSPSFPRSRGKMDRELAAFFSEMFGLDVRQGDLANIQFAIAFHQVSLFVYIMTSLY